VVSAKPEIVIHDHGCPLRTKPRPGVRIMFEVARKSQLIFN
jgi:hypothetical protein